ncbi:MAG: zinc-dependent metalloprotease [Phaeodactylibacter sp.]|nr:zinc-dependent metalloprotease [Phaeodactylibacter sp.]MCB9265737.1 zinc-dependent metalloprotease [Lewinellaceae bacterium]MCB9285813.1 zinc-dependent metalloprotease [Lewinellaceae bacterium]
MRFFLLVLWWSACWPASFAQIPTISEKTNGFRPFEGFFKFYYDEKEGNIWLEVDKWEVEFLYVNSLTGGLGSNDIGLDRNQLGESRVVKFLRSGPKVLLLEPNFRFRAETGNPEERRAVEEAFAQSVLGGFKVEAEEGGHVLIDLTPFLLRDAHGVAERLKDRKQGNYKLDEKRSALWLERTKNFPKNSEFEALLTFEGTPEGSEVRSVAPTPEVLSLRMHHSFVELPDSNYRPRVFDPRSGYYALSFQDYGAPIGQPLTRRFIYRHRLEKKKPGPRMSEPVEPIIYYLDRGVPEPIRSALIEGASWWNEAFEVAGYRNAFQVKELPEGADPMDVRYNVINWVHRSTRGWSYGSTVSDPRTGEIIKGHVLLGSLRVRQDYLIAQGLIQAYEDGKTPDPRLEEMALARLRQLSAHEVGHTLGLTHNFAASYNDRASVMDYPHPYITLDDKGEMDFSQAYDTGIGEWDKRAILYGYQDFPEGTGEAAALESILRETVGIGLKFISDEGARPAGGGHPYAHLWDNGASAVEELERLMEVRRKALEEFGEKNIPEGLPLATLEDVLVPLYFAHRYQVEAVTKLIGGVEYSYAVRGDGQETVTGIVPPEQQVQALKALVGTLRPGHLALPESTLDAVPPRPAGYHRGRELFKTYNGGIGLDGLAAAESSLNHTIQLMLNPQRLARLVEQHARDEEQPSVNYLIEEMLTAVQVYSDQSPLEKQIARIGEKLILHQLLRLAKGDEVMSQVSAIAMFKVNQLEDYVSILPDKESDVEQQAHYLYMLEQIRRFRNNPEAWKMPEALPLPDGAPIGCGRRE